MIISRYSQSLFADRGGGGEGGKFVSSSSPSLPFSFLPPFPLHPLPLPTSCISLFLPPFSLCSCSLSLFLYSLHSILSTLPFPFFPLLNSPPSFLRRPHPYPPHTPLLFLFTFFHPPHPIFICVLFYCYKLPPTPLVLLPVYSLIPSVLHFFSMFFCMIFLLFNNISHVPYIFFYNFSSVLIVLFHLFSSLLVATL